MVHTFSSKLHNTILDVQSLVHQPLVGQLGAQGGQRVHCTIHQNERVNLSSACAANTMTMMTMFNMMITMITVITLMMMITMMTIMIVRHASSMCQACLQFKLA